MKAHPTPGVHYEDGWVVTRKTSKGWVIDGFYHSRRHARCFANRRKVCKARRIIVWDQPTEKIRLPKLRPIGPTGSIGGVARKNPLL